MWLDRATSPNRERGDPTGNTTVYCAVCNHRLPGNSEPRRVRFGEYIRPREKTPPKGDVLSLVNRLLANWNLVSSEIIRWNKVLRQISDENRLEAQYA